MGNSVFKSLKTVAKVGVLLAADAAGRKVMGIRADYDALKTDVDNLKAAVNGAMERIAQKVAELGEPDPDLNAIRTSIQEETARVSGIVAAPTEPGTGEDGGTGGDTGGDTGEGTLPGTGEGGETGGGE